MKRVLCAAFVAASVVAAAQQPAPLTIPAIFAEGGITGREPENVKWSPDGQRVAFVLRDDSGEKGALYYVDPADSAGRPPVRAINVTTIVGFCAYGR